MFGLDLSLHGLIELFKPFAYEAHSVYGFVVVFMLLSSFGMPIPEELVLVSSGLIAYMAKHPETFPPPAGGGTPVETNTLMMVCFLAVFLSDSLVYFIGKFLGTRMMRHPWVQKQMGGKTYAIIQKWFDKYGAWCCGIFRFTPGIRFPGHLSCGILGIPVWKFFAIDFLAAIVSVPTQVWAVSTYGEEILAHLQEYKLILLGVGGLAFGIWWLRKRAQEEREAQGLEK